MMRNRRSLFSLGIAFATIVTASSICSATAREVSHKQIGSVNMRQVTLAFATYTHSGGRIRYRPNSFQNMEDFIRLLGEEVDFTEAAIFLSHYEAPYFVLEPPKVTGIRDRAGNFEFQPDIMAFPIAFSFAVYPDLAGPSNLTPILWTRGLHNYKDFQEPYGGHIAFMDCHVTYYWGEPGEPNPELDAIFGPDSQFSQVLRILEHEPKGWASEEPLPLPVRHEKPYPYSPIKRAKTSFLIFGPAVLAGFLAALLPKPSMAKRIWSAFVVFCIVLIATMILLPRVGSV